MSRWCVCGVQVFLEEYYNCEERDSSRFRIVARSLREREREERDGEK